MIQNAWYILILFMNWTTFSVFFSVSFPFTIYFLRIADSPWKHTNILYVQKVLTYLINLVYIWNGSRLVAHLVHIKNSPYFSYQFQKNISVWNPIEIRQGKDWRFLMLQLKNKNKSGYFLRIYNSVLKMYLFLISTGAQTLTNRIARSNQRLNQVTITLVGVFFIFFKILKWS